ncbi:lytic transglycosylase domain-containing protein (plasmid) [Escherichia coli]|uniref:lytic transglycosylase domain-containing protein n=1 Tax=Enterobacteriaceae TaxID=543 RepID=UPI00097D7574|nr:MULTISPECIES: lytic transglycosylase domain-containing protein [Enterobacteriaceae]EFZ4074305.1 lytic transglycosylase domain-containing protein [Shigella flexneri]EFC4278582.1 lytic transglycosylase domain-containing protein [Escherichia coli]EFK6687074.1 lytic transglycosylase domain-containing protein [Escherichia coli]MDS1455415.1 lytic transglycosylase domain-containing protein [Escherichia coli]MDS1461100.1 lytic transglycosylase domain-containing protein [Escherichia coli]
MSVLTPVFICLMQASAANHVPAEVLTSIISVEGGKHGISVHNKNQTEDLGIMQINTGVWLPLVSKTFFNNDTMLAYERLKNDDCFNIQVGAWILGYSIYLEKGNMWSGVGRYHSNTPALKNNYEEKVKKRYIKLFGMASFYK